MRAYATKTFTTNDSPVVPHLSTELAQRCLVSQIGRDATRSPRYERMMTSARLDPPGPPQVQGGMRGGLWGAVVFPAFYDETVDFPALCTNLRLHSEAGPPGRGG